MFSRFPPEGSERFIEESIDETDDDTEDIENRDASDRL